MHLWYSALLSSSLPVSLLQAGTAGRAARGNTGGRRSLLELPAEQAGGDQDGDSDEWPQSTRCEGFHRDSRLA